MKSGCCFCACLLIITFLQAPGCWAQGKQTRISHASNPKYIHCLPQTSVKSCPPQDVYRNINGACNNRERPSVGASDTAFVRWLPAEYEDGISLPQGWTEDKLYNGHPLPLVREVSNKIVSCLGKPESADEERSQVFMEWGQFITHDMVFSPLGFLDCNPKTPPGDPCVKGEPENSFPIMIPPGDPSAKLRGKCLSFSRIGPACTSETEVREPANIVTSFLDASALYGSHECYAKMLKDNTNNLGLLAVNKRFTVGSQEFLPFDEDIADQCSPSVFCIRKNPCPLMNTTYNIPCFLPGDKRGNQNLAYMTINTIFLREHNRLARELKKLNPHWNGEKIYQEARKIMAAVVQVITYKDYLPLVLGDWMDIELPPYDKYKEDVDPRIATVFVLAFRFAHTTIPPFLFRLDSNYKPFDPDFKIPFHQSMFTTWKLVMEGGIDPLLRGLVINYAKLMKHDTMMSDEVRERLFKTPPQAIGIDLASIDLQRGRDFGLPRYNAWRRYCGLTEPRNLVDLAAVFKSEELARKILDLYKTPENIDLWIGGIAEPFVENGRVGPLFTCLIGSQFRKIRDGDRFWWQNPGVFSKKQRSALSTVTLSRIICDNSGLKEVPRNVFKSNEFPEDLVSCSTINKLDLSAWKEGKGHGEKQHTEL